MGTAFRKKFLSTAFVFACSCNIIGTLVLAANDDDRDDIDQAQKNEKQDHRPHVIAACFVAGLFAGIFLVHSIYHKNGGTFRSLSFSKILTFTKESFLDCYRILIPPAFVSPAPNTTVVQPYGMGVMRPPPGGSQHGLMDTSVNGTYAPPVEDGVELSTYKSISDAESGRSKG